MNEISLKPGEIENRQSKEQGTETQNNNLKDGLIIEKSGTENILEAEQISKENGNIIPKGVNVDGTIEIKKINDEKINNEQQIKIEGNDGNIKTGGVEVNIGGSELQRNDNLIQIRMNEIQNEKNNIIGDQKTLIDDDNNLLLLYEILQYNYNIDGKIGLEKDIKKGGNVSELAIESHGLNINEGMEQNINKEKENEKKETGVDGEAGEGNIGEQNKKLNIDLTANAEKTGIKENELIIESQNNPLENKNENEKLKEEKKEEEKKEEEKKDEEKKEEEKKDEEKKDEEEKENEKKIEEQKEEHKKETYFKFVQKVGRGFVYLNNSS